MNGDEAKKKLVHAIKNKLKKYKYYKHFTAIGSEKCFLSPKNDYRHHKDNFADGGNYAHHNYDGAIAATDVKNEIINSLFFSQSAVYLIWKPPVKNKSSYISYLHPSILRS